MGIKVLIVLTSGIIALILGLGALIYVKVKKEPTLLYTYETIAMGLGLIVASLVILLR